MVRGIGAVVAGIIVVGVVVVVLQSLSLWIYPPPEGLDFFDPAQADAVAEYMAGVPTASWALALVSEVLGAFCGAWVTGSIARDRKPVFAGVIFALALAGSINNWLSFSHPTGFIVGELVTYPLAFFAVVRLLQRE